MAERLVSLKAVLLVAYLAELSVARRVVLWDELER